MPIHCVMGLQRDWVVGTLKAWARRNLPCPDVPGNHWPRSSDRGGSIRLWWAPLGTLADDLCCVLPTVRVYYTACDAMSNALELIKATAGVASIAGMGFGAYRSIRSDLVEVENRLRSDFREDLRGVETRLREAISSPRPKDIPDNRISCDRPRSIGPASVEPENRTD